MWSKIKSIEPDGKEDVYCLEVQETGNFVANGIVIKNCDALRYFISSHKVSRYDPYAKQAEHKQAWGNRYEPTRTNFR